MESEIKHARSIAACAAMVVACAACAGDQGPAADQAAVSVAPGCIAAGGGSLHAQLRGAIVSDLIWTNRQMQCEGGARPDGKGLRVTIAGPADHAGANAGQTLRFIFGIDLADVATGSAQALPTNVTVIVEGEQQIYATLGSDKCAVEALERTPLLSAGSKLDRVQVRGYCTEPASDLTGTKRLLIPTFDFTALVHAGGAP